MHIKNFKYRKHLLVLLVTAAVLAVILFACSSSVPDYIVSSATVEAGSSFQATDFIRSGDHSASFSGDFADRFVQNGYAKINQIGQYLVNLTVDGKDYRIKLTVKDTVAPKAAGRTVTVRQGDSLLAKHCVTAITDETNVTCTFKSEPNLSRIGTVNQVVILTDDAGNSTEIPVSICIIAPDKKLTESYTIEAGSAFPTADAMIAFGSTGKYVTDVSTINTNLVGSHSLQLEIDGTVYTTTFQIQDTVAPTAVVLPATIYYGGKFPAASTFVTAIADAGPVTASYDIDPGATVTNQTMLRIVLTDQGGNTTYYTTPCTIVHDNVAPQILTYPTAIDADIGASIIFRSSVTATDDSGIVELTLDTANAKLNKAGTYTVYIVATDPAGNETRQETKLILHDNSVTKEMMDAVCEQVLSKIITEGMTTQQKLYAIYKYVVKNIQYISDSPHDDLRREAYLSLTTRKYGDCFSFCAASYELITYLGYEAQIVRRDIALSKIYGNHFWVFVNCGTEENPQWYHHDSSPHTKPYDLETYMMTDAQAKAYTNYRAKTSYKKHYYTFDPSLYPASATEIVVELPIPSRYFD